MRVIFGILKPGGIVDSKSEWVENPVGGGYNFETTQELGEREPGDWCERDPGHWAEIITKKRPIWWKIL